MLNRYLLLPKQQIPTPFDHPFNNVDSLCDPEMYGTLQWAINKVNKTNSESIIEFNIPGAGPHEIALSYYLPQIKNKVTIDGTSQPGYQTGDPAITIRGHIKLKSCFDAYSVVNIQGLHITDFSSHGIIITKGEGAQVKDNLITNIHNEDGSLPGIGIRLVSSYHCVVQGNKIGTGGNPEEPTQVDNYGIYLQKSSYCTIGDTTENLKNTITNCDLGVLVEGGIRNKLSGNSIYDNHKAAIYLSNGGNNSIQAPGMTEYVDGMLKGTSQPGYTIEIFGSTGNENANHYLGTTTANDYGEWYLNITTNYPYYIATATDHENNTSKLSWVVEAIKLYECPENLMENCNFICNSEMSCIVEGGCGTSAPPPAWYSSHGSCDYCENNETEAICGYSVDDLDNLDEYISFFSGYNIESYSDEEHSEGVYTYLNNELLPYQSYSLNLSKKHTYNNDYSGTISFSIKLISQDIIDNYFSISSYITPTIPLGEEFSYTLYQEVIINDSELEDFEISFNAPASAQNYAGVWICAKPNGDNKVASRIYIDDFRLEHEMPQYTAETSQTCTELNSNVILSIDGPNIYNYLWSGPGDWVSNNQTNNITLDELSDFGVYEVQVSHNDNCYYSSSVSIYHNSVDVNLGPDIFVCEGSEVTLSAEISGGNQPYTLLWNNGSQDNEIDIQPSVATTYSVTVTDENGCTASDEVLVDPAYPLPPAPEPYNTGPYCAGETIELFTQQQEGLIYAWHSSAFNIPEEGETAAHISSGYSEEYFEYTIDNAKNKKCCADDLYDMYFMDGLYTVSVMNEYGCVRSASTFVEVYPEDISCLSLDVLNLNTNSFENFCAGDDIQIEFSGNYSGLCGLNDSELTISGPTLDNEPVNSGTYIIENIGPEHSGIYTITVSTMCYEITFETDEIIVHDPSVSLQYSYGFCEGDEMIIEPNYSDNIESFEWEGPEFFQSTGPVLERENVVQSMEGIYEIIVTDVFGCSDVASTNVIVFDYLYPGDLTVNSNSPVCSGENVTISAESSYNGPTTYHWYGPDGNPISSEQSITIEDATFNDIGDYMVEVHFNPGINSPCEYLSQTTSVIVTDCEEAFDVSCTQVPVTCHDPYNGSIEFSINDGEPPYNAYAYRNGTLLNYIENLDSDGNYTMDLQGVEPNDNPINMVIEDNDGNSSFFTITGGLNYAWDNVITQNNLYYNNQYEDQILCVGDDQNQGLDFYQDFSFDDCIIYTSTYHVSELEDTKWFLNMPNTLEIYNTTIKSGCPDQMWQGIYADGITGDFQSPDDTKVLIENSAICDAMKAVDVFGGGTLTAINSEFINNVYDLLFYDSQTGAITIRNNEFKTNSLLNFQTFYPKSHIYLYKSSDLIFKGNEFKNSLPYDFDPDYPVHKRGVGIDALTSSFTVTPVSQITWEPIGINSENRFEGLFYGIKTDYDCTTPPGIYYNEFENNFRGMYLANTHGSRVLFNDFQTTQEDFYFDEEYAENINGLPDVASTYGMYVNSCRQFSIEENSFKNGDAGIYIYNTGEAEGLNLYRNKFGNEPQSGNPYNMNAATVVVGKNSDYIEGSDEDFGYEGLQTRCNDYTATENAISVINGNMRKLQGVPGGNTDQLAGNQFHETFTNGTEFTTQITPGFEAFDLGTYKYFQHDDFVSDNNGFFRELENYAGVSAYTQGGEGYTSQESCLTNYGGGPIIEPGELIVLIANLQDNLASKQTEYDQMVDNGNTAYLVNLAENMDSPNFLTTTPHLCNDGYLSDTVFEAIINNHNAPRPKIAYLLMENSPLPDNIMEMVENSGYLKNGHKKHIRRKQSGINARVLLEYEMSDIKQEIASIESKMLIHAINNDSVPAYREDVMNYFSNTADMNIENYIDRFNLLMAKNDYAEAQNILNALRNHAISLNNDSVSLEVQRYCDVHDILITVLNDNQNEKTELEQHLAFLRQAAQGFSPWYSGVAETLYEQFTDSVFLEYTPLPQPEVTPKNMVAEQDDDTFTPELNVYPNPTKDELYVEYNFQSETGNGNDLLLAEMGHKQAENCAGGEIAVYTIEGKIIFRKNLNQASGIEIINMNDYKPANYVVEIKDCYGFSKEHKIVKQ